MNTIYYINSYEFFLLPVYLLIAGFAGRQFIKKSGYPKYISLFFFFGLFLKLFGSIVFALMQQYFFMEGDTFMYFSTGLDIQKELLNNFPSGIKLYFMEPGEFSKYYETHFDNTHNFGYVAAARNLFTAKISSVLSILGFGGYLLTSLLFGTLAFSGMWRMFSLFRSLFPSLTKELALCFLFMPSIIYWGAGIMKDTICLAAIGWLFSEFYYFFIAGQKKFLKLVIIFICFYVLLNIKSYIAACMLIVLILWLVIRLVSGKKTISTAFSLSILAAIIIITAISFDSLLVPIQENLLEQFSNYINDSQTLYEMMGSDKALMTNISYVNPTWSSILSNIPAALLNALFRPFIWEATNINILIAAIENLFFMLFCIYVLVRVGPVRILKKLFSSQLLAICLLFTLLFSIFIGLTCFNFGTIVRYRLPSVPFFFLTLLLLKNHWVEPNKI